MKNLIIWVLLVVGIAYGGAKFYLHHKVETGLDSAISMMSPFARLSYDGVSSTMTGKLTVNGLRVSIKGFKDEIYVDHFGIDTPNFLTLLELGDIAAGKGIAGSEFPSYIGFIVDGMRLAVSSDYYQEIYDLGIAKVGTPSDIDEPGVKCVGKYGHSPAALANLGYNEQLVSFAMYLRMNGPRELMNMTASVDDMWDVELDLTLAQGGQSAMTGNAMGRRKMSEMKFVLTDRSLNERVSKYCERLGLSPDETLKARVDALQFVAKNNGVEFDEYIIEPYKEFLTGKSTFVVTAEPTNPVNLTQLGLYKPSDVPALLNLSATAQ